MHGCALRNSVRLARHAKPVRSAITSTPASHSDINTSCHDQPLFTDSGVITIMGAACVCGTAALACCSKVTVSAAGSSGSSSGVAQNRPTTACSATSHHKPHWVLAGKRRT
ncbi:hypothetical protein D3C81_1344690 [compost metagenome]